MRFSARSRLVSATTRIGVVAAIAGALLVAAVPASASVVPPANAGTTITISPASGPLSTIYNWTSTIACPTTHQESAQLTVYKLDGTLISAISPAVRPVDQPGFGGPVDYPFSQFMNVLWFPGTTYELSADCFDAGDGVVSWASVYVTLSNTSYTTHTTPTPPGVPATTTALGVSPASPVVQGTSVTLTATVTPASPAPVGNVTFKDGATVLGTAPVNAGTARLVTTTIPAGTHSLTAQFVPTDGKTQGSTSPPVTYTVNPAPSAAPGTFVPLTPARILDTRAGVGAPKAAVAGQSGITVQVTGRGGVPASGVGAVVLNITVTAPTAPGYITAYPAGTTRPVVSNLNFVAGQTVPNLANVKLSPGGAIGLFNGAGSGSAHLIADVAGYYRAGTPTAAGTYNPLAPNRILDTRVGTGAPKAPVRGQTALNLTVAGRGGVPATGVSAVVLNVTATSPTAPGYITAYPTGAPRPVVSNLNFTAGRTVPNLVTVKLGANGAVSLFNGAAATGAVQLIADVAGYYLAGTPQMSGAFVPLDPSRILDSRTGNGAGGPVPAHGTVTLQVAGRGGVPTTGAGAVVMNTTVTQPQVAGFVTVFPAGQAPPLASNLNFVAGLTVANLTSVKLGGGKVGILNGSGGTVQLIGDVSGYFIA